MSLKRIKIHTVESKNLGKNYHAMIYVESIYALGIEDEYYLFIEDESREWDYKITQIQLLRKVNMDGERSVYDLQLD